MVFSTTHEGGLGARLSAYGAALVLLCTLIACTPSHQPNDIQGASVSHQTKSPKRGVAFNFSNVQDLPLLAPAISWDYNWANSTGDESAIWFDARGIDFCPMCWNGSYNADKIRAYVAAHPKTKYLLAFNEPNLTDQANLTPAQAAAVWQNVVELARGLNLKIVSPAMNYGSLAGYSDPIVWLDEFFAQPQVSIDDICAISVHCYMGSAGAMSGFINQFAKYNKPIWLSEFCAWENVSSVEAQMNYMCQALTVLEQSDMVERYAWFIPRTSAPVDAAPYMQLLTHDLQPALTELGYIYRYFPTFNINDYLITSRLIFAGEYASVVGNVQLRHCTEPAILERAGDDGLFIKAMREGTQVTYQLSVPNSTSSLTLYYISYSDCTMHLALTDGSEIDVSLSRTAGAWGSTTVNLPCKKGLNNLTVTLTHGSIHFGGLQLN